MVENMIGKKVFLIDDLGDGEMLMCSDTVTAILIEENSMSVRCKTSGDEFWTVGKNVFFTWEMWKTKTMTFKGWGDA